VVIFERRVQFIADSRQTETEFQRMTAMELVYRIDIGTVQCVACRGRVPVISLTVLRLRVICSDAALATPRTRAKPRRVASRACTNRLIGTDTFDVI